MENQKISNTLKEKIIKDIKNKGLPVLICGTGIVGDVLFSICKEKGIKIDGFCDSSEKAVKSKFKGYDVIHTPELKKKYDDAVIIISAAAIKDVVDLIESMGFTNWYAGAIFLNDFDIRQNNPDYLLDYKKYAIENCILCHKGFLNKNKLFFRSIDIIITERCSLKCKDCSNLMQYYEKPQNCDTGELFKSIDVFSGIVDEVMDFRVIGGEPFMNKEWPIIVRKLAKEPKGRRVVIYTNGTIIPNDNDMEALKDKKVMVIISNYGKTSRNLSGLKQTLEKNGIIHYVLGIEEWLDCSNVKPHNRTLAQKKELFKTCCAKNMATLSDGKIFRCPYAANAFRLKAVPDIKNDYVDIMKVPINKDIKKEIEKYILEKEFMEICDYCSGRPLSGVEVKPAVQITTPLKYNKY